MARVPGMFLRLAGSPYPEVSNASFSIYLRQRKILIESSILFSRNLYNEASGSVLPPWHGP